MTAPKKPTQTSSSTKNASDPDSCTQAQVCAYLRRLSPDKPLKKPSWANQNPKNNWLQEFYERYAEMYEAVVQLEAWVYCSTPANKPQPIIASKCPPGGGNPPQKSGSPPPPPFP